MEAELGVILQARSKLVNVYKTSCLRTKDDTQILDDGIYPLPQCVWVCWVYGGVGN